MGLVAHFAAPVMPEEIILRSTRCPICDIEGGATLLFPANFDFAAFNPAVYSARRLPDRVHYRIVRCNTCGLVRSDPVADPQLLAQLYAKSTFDYELEVEDLSRTYGRYLGRLERFDVHKDKLLEIGCGNGFFLEEALRRGYSSVHGVEPGKAAIDRARDDIRPSIVNDILRPGLFPPETFDVVCLFQTFDHISDPGSLLDECGRLLRPGGLLLCFNHNIEAASAKLLGERSPIVDIEHTFLYSPRTISKLFEKHEFKTLETGSARNTYHLYYLTRLLPLPGLLKKPLLRLLKDTRFGGIRLTVALGNLYIIARKQQDRNPPDRITTEDTEETQRGTEKPRDTASNHPVASAADCADWCSDPGHSALCTLQSVICNLHSAICSP